MQVKAWGTSKDAASVFQEAESSDLYKSTGSANGKDFHERKLQDLKTKKLKRVEKEQVSRQAFYVANSTDTGTIY